MKRIVRLVGVVLLAAVMGLAVYGFAAAGGDQPRPFKAQSFEVVTSEGILPGSTCPAFEVNSTGNGTGTHLGNFTIVRRHCFTPPDHPAFAGQVIHDGVYEISKDFRNEGIDRRRVFELAAGQFIRNREDIESVVRSYQPEVVFHLAGQVAMTTSIENPRLDFETNALGTFNLLEAVRRFAPGLLDRGRRQSGAAPLEARAESRSGRPAA